VIRNIAPPDTGSTPYTTVGDSPDAQNLAQARLSLLTVLIVDDDESTRILLRAVLAEIAEFEAVNEADCGAAAIRLAKALQPDFTLLDLRMPDVDGASALQQLRIVAPNSTIIVVSATDPTSNLALLDIGAVAFIPKGLSPRDLIEQLETIFRDHVLCADLHDTAVELTFAGPDAGVGLFGRETSSTGGSL
jgi:DNA-binding NarL/FixJ family response regulator